MNRFHEQVGQETVSETFSFLLPAETQQSYGREEFPEQIRKDSLTESIPESSTDGLQEPIPVPVIRIQDIPLQPVQWLWKPYIPFGKITIIQGNPGEGKTTFALALAAACTTGGSIPCMEPHEPFNVIVESAEDGIADTIKPRLMEAGADLSRTLVIDEMDEMLTFTDERVERAIIENQARMIIFDPIQAFLGTSVDINKANEVRPIFRKLGEMAERTGCAVILIGHLNKAAGIQSAYRGLGSIDFRAAARSLLVIGRVRDQPHIRVICHDKSSLAPEGESIAFSLGTEEGFRWIGPYQISADELLSGNAGNRENKAEQAKAIILNLLETETTVYSEEINQKTEEAGISERTVRTVKSELTNAGLIGKKRNGEKWQYFKK